MYYHADLSVSAARDFVGRGMRLREEMLVALRRGAALGLALLSGCATADYAQVADSWTTAIALGSGFSEGNPVFHGAGWPVIAAAKLGVTQVVKLTPEPVCSAGLFGLTVTGIGATAWNIGVMLGSGLAALPFAGALIWHNWGTWQEHAVHDCQTAQNWIERWR